MVTSTQTLRIVAETEFAGAAADVIAAVVQHKPGAVLGLPTGNTPLPVYRELIIRHQCGKLDLSRVQVVQLDEYLGVTPQEPTSFAAWLRTHLLDACAIGPERVHLLPAGGSGAALDHPVATLNASCRPGVDATCRCSAWG